ncbi:histidinol-phosphatase HisJ family protein [Cohnella sp. CFH 77786]|uniref:histidinol-phosphatase n=1 Tax=Cohnella sp. CFH 77786 TaxID=2662265 RepID=UPI001C610062|nr:histidinol-phosphatase [Cohnella sp. CFH 77786]MBW5447357.1 histidinol-phosphatase HisJ family protein [Cohnella sp. CFH 77786]
MKFDLHTHHERCGHAEGNIEAYIRAAMDAGLTAIGISDHSPYFAKAEDHPHPGIAMAKSEFSRYVEEVLRLKEKYGGRIEVLLGVESDFFRDEIDEYRAAYEPYPFDYIIGSVHQTRGISIFNRNRWKKLSESEKVEDKKEYYRLIRESANAGLFQILGHIDAMKGYYPAFSDILGAEAEIDAVFQAVVDNDIALEINTSGKTKDVGGWYPSDEMLERALHYGADVTFGSDAHVPHRVGDEWELVRKRLKEIGFTRWVYYRQKRKVIVPL